MTDLWIVLLAAGLLTFLTRLSFISLLSGREFPLVVMRALHFVPPAVLTAIVFPELLFRDGALHAGLGNPRLIAGLIAIVVAWKVRGIFPTIAIGMLALWLLQATAA